MLGALVRWVVLWGDVPAALSCSHRFWLLREERVTAEVGAGCLRSRCLCCGPQGHHFPFIAGRAHLGCQYWGGVM